MKDVVLVALLVVALAVLLTVHVTIVFGLVRRKPRWRAPFALVIAPLAPLFAWREHMRVRAVLWAGSLVTYLAALAVGHA